MRKLKIMAAAGLIGALYANAELSVVQNGDYLAVKRDGNFLIESIRMNLGEAKPNKLEHSFTELADGTKVWNSWCAENDRRYRIEVAERADKAIEITMTSEAGALCPNKTRLIELDVPKDVFEGKEYKALSGNGRSYTPIEGVFQAGGAAQYDRWLAVDGITYDFNPLGAVDYCSGYGCGAVRGIWNVARANNRYKLTGGSVLGYSFGGFTGGKLVIREGQYEDYDKYHLIRRFSYEEHLPAKYLLAFGAPKTGSQFADGNVAYSEDRGYGWLNALPYVNVGYKEGAFYSNVNGSGKATYRISGLQDGFYVMTASIGNYPGTGMDNIFSIDVNGDVIAENLKVAPKTLKVISRAVHVTGGIADFHFTGNYMLSVIGVQPVMGDGEDFSMNRAFWLVDAYEPGSIYRNMEAAVKPVLPTAIHTVVLPVPSHESDAVPTEPPTPVNVPDPSMKSLAWLKNAKLYSLLTNSSTLAELDDPAVMKKYFDQEMNGKNFSAAMISGMHSRHTYFAHLDRGRDAIGRIAKELHSRNIKLIDHHDATLLWNVDAGLRTLMERLPELALGRDDMLPSFQLCPVNPIFSEKYYAYLRGLIEVGVDGFQIDELNTWAHTCGCSFCREKFHEQTGWYMPLNELDEQFANQNSPLRKRWFDWTYKTVTNWFVEFRERNKDIKPDLVLNMYTTDWGFTRCAPRYFGSSNLIDLGRTLNFFGTEIMPRNVLLNTRPLLPFRKMKNLLTIAYGSPVWGEYYCSDWKVNYYGWCVANMHGQAALLSDVTNEPETPEFEKFGAGENNMNKEGASTVTKVALLFSQNSRDWNSSISFEGEIFGLAQSLEEMHVPYEFIGDMSVTEKQLAKYKMICLGTSQCLSDTEVAVLKKFAENGGHVYMNIIAGTCDEIGIARDKWAFEDVFGFEPLKRVRKIEKLKIDGKEFENRETVFSFAPVDVENGQLHVSKEYGKGRFTLSTMLVASELYMRNVTPPNEYTFNPDPALDKFYKEQIASIMGDAMYWHTDAPERVYTALWREKNGTLVAHFLNATGSYMKVGEKLTPYAPNPAFPALEKDITFTLPMEKCKSAVAVSPDYAEIRKLAVTENGDGTVSIVLPKDSLKAYTLVKIR